MIRCNYYFNKLPVTTENSLINHHLKTLHQPRDLTDELPPRSPNQTQNNHLNKQHNNLQSDRRENLTRQEQD